MTDERGTKGDRGKTKALRILIAEDNSTNRLVVAGFLAKLGYSGDIATNGREVLEKLEGGSYDLILMDCHMPEVDGFEATQQVIAKYGISRPRIVALSASTAQEDVERCLSAGMDAFLAKPIKLESLLKVLIECASGQKVTRLPVSSSYRRDLFLNGFQGMEDLAQSAARSFLQLLPKMLADIRSSIDSQDAKRLEISAHALKGAVSNFYAELSVRLAGELESLGRLGSVDGADAIFRQLDSELSRFAQELQASFGESSAA